MIEEAGTLICPFCGCVAITDGKNACIEFGNFNDFTNEPDQEGEGVAFQCIVCSSTFIDFQLVGVLSK
jgi:hypothetical protein